MYDKEMNFIGKYESGTWVERNSKELFGVKLLKSEISKVATGKRPHYKGFIFRYTKYIDK